MHSYEEYDEEISEVRIYKGQAEGGVWVGFLVLKLEGARKLFIH
jgi:hypothetical protein